MSTRTGPGRRFPFVIAGVLALLGHALPAAVLAAFGTTMAQLDAVRPDLTRRADARITAVATGLGHGVGAVALTLVWALLLIPAWCITRLLRRDGLDAGRGWAAHPVAEDTAPTDAFGVEPRMAVPASIGQRLTTFVPLALGWLAIAVALNYGAGWLWDEFVGSHDTPAAIALAPLDDPAVIARRPALVDQVWALDHLTDYQSLEYRYRPFLMEELVDGTYGDIVVRDARRRTFEPAGLGADAPEIWLFGGSTVFGKGQRDDHTVASELARLAAAGGTPVRVLNFGNPGYTSYQEWQVFERQLASGRRPAVAVFLDGTADLEVQAEAPTPDPTHFNRRRVDMILTGEAAEVVGLEDLGARYLEDSLIGRLWNNVESLVGIDPAGAAETSIADNATDLGARARLLTAYLGERDDVSVLFVREPRPIGGPTRSAYRSVTERLTDTDIDLSRLLDGREDLYLDWIHVNETGAALIADRLFEEVDDYLDG